MHRNWTLHHQVHCTIHTNWFSGLIYDVRENAFNATNVSLYGKIIQEIRRKISESVADFISDSINLKREREREREREEGGEGKRGREMREYESGRKRKESEGEKERQ